MEEKIIGTKMKKCPYCSNKTDHAVVVRTKTIDPRDEGSITYACSRCNPNKKYENEKTM